MNNRDKGRSPFYPGQPVPQEFFTGRLEEVKLIARAINQVSLGKPQAIFLTGEYGIGKSSLASLMRYYAENKYNMLGIHVMLGGAETLDEVAQETVREVIESQAFKPAGREKILNFFGKYINKLELDTRIGSIGINMEALKVDAPNISNGFLPFLKNLNNNLAERGNKGIMLIFDEINGITENPQFAFFIKSLVDKNALSDNVLPLLLILCGVKERRYEMIRHHQPVDRIFDIIDIGPMDENETKDFFRNAFSTVNIKIEDKELEKLYIFSEGFPKIMHIFGDILYWIDDDAIINGNDVNKGLILTIEDIGRKHIEPQIYNALKSKDYQSIFKKLGSVEFYFKKRDLEKGLTENEKNKLKNFLQKMKKLNVLKSGGVSGEYVFTRLIYRSYIVLQNFKDTSKIV